MRKFVASLAAVALLTGGLAAPVSAQRGHRGADTSRGDQQSARQEMQAGRTMSSREIESRIVPRMKGSDYLGFEYDAGASAYRLKFIKEGRVTWVDVDARTGRVLQISK